MRKHLSRLALTLMLLLCLCPLLVGRARAADLDLIQRYQVDVTPNTADGSLLIRVDIDWKVLDEGPVSWVKIGIPNGSLREETPLSDNIAELNYDNSYMYIYLNRDYDDGESFHIAYSWVQEYMYTINDDGSLSYDYTPGWFDEAVVQEMSLTWHDPEAAHGTGSDGQVGGEHVLTRVDMGHGETMGFSVRYDFWPTELDWENSRDNAPTGDIDYYPSDYDYNYDYDYGYDSGIDAGTVIVILVIIAYVVIRIVAASDGYSGGFGTHVHYVHVGGLWFPAGPDGRPRPGSHGTKEKPRPPRNGGGFGGGGRGGGFGGGGFGGGGHCACASSCACACACACAGGGRAGCSAKNLYGAVRLDQELSRKLEE